MNIPKEIDVAIREGNLVIFAGAGLSMRFSLPDWKTLVREVILETGDKKLELLLPVLDSDLLSPMEVLDKIKSEHAIIRKYISKKFNLINEDYSFHRKLIKLSNKIITTNFDNAFENAFDNKVFPSTYTSDFNISQINKNSDAFILKLHGTFSEADKCVVFKEDYDNLYSNDKSAILKLKSLFSDKIILFLGFSFSDPEINLIFDNLDKSFSNFNRHYLLTTTPKNFDNYRFIKTIPILDFDEIEKFIEQCLSIKSENTEKIYDIEVTLPDKDLIVTSYPKIAYLSPNPIDLSLGDDLVRVMDCFKNIQVNLFVGALNIKTVSQIDDYDLLIIVSKSFKSNIYIEDDNLKSGLVSPRELCQNIPNDKIPIVFICDENIKTVSGFETIVISTLKPAIINKFIYKSLRNGQFDYVESEINLELNNLFQLPIVKGNAVVKSIYQSNKDLDIGKKSLKNVVGRIEEQSALALKILSIRTSNKFLNIKASGGTGKTTLIKKVAYELYNRGYFVEGVTFNSCENTRTFDDFEELLKAGFNLSNILDFVGHLIENHSLVKKDSLIILDNFETIVNLNDRNEFLRILDLLKFATDYANIAITSRESISLANDFEDLYSLTPLTTDDALSLFVKGYGKVPDDEIKILRSDILEDMLNNNPLAIKLVTQSRTKFKHIFELKQQLAEHFFESVNEDYGMVYSNNADLNIERTRSLFQSINYSYTTLTTTEKLCFELLSLFPDGIGLSNFKKCFERKKAVNQIGDNDLRRLRDKSLIEDYNGTLQLQPIIRRFAEYQFSRRPKDIKQKYSLDAYSFNCFILEIIEFIEIKKNSSESLVVFSLYKNNLLKVLTYISDIPITDKGLVRDKTFFLNYIYSLSYYVVTEKQIREYQEKLDEMASFFADLPYASTLILVLKYLKTYFHKEFDISYDALAKILPVSEMESRIFSDEHRIIERYKSNIANVHSMEGHTLKYVNSYILNNNDTSKFLSNHFFYLGISSVLDEKDKDFYYFESQNIFNELNVSQLEDYIKILHQDESLEIVQATYTLSKIRVVEKGVIQKLVVTNPYTKGLKELMMAFVSTNNDEKTKYFRSALSNLSHIKYYYLEALYFYCLYLRDLNSTEFESRLEEGVTLSGEYYYQYLSFLFSSIESKLKLTYQFSYSFYPIAGLESYILKHNQEWAKKFKEAYS